MALSLADLALLPDQPLIRYRNVADFPGYAVGDDGTLWSCKARFGGTDSVWHLLPLRLNATGYPSALLYRGALDKRLVCRRSVHRLVLEAFVGSRPAGMECRHLDGNPLNNRLDNLCWGTPRENAADRKLHGGDYDRTGELNPRAKLTEARVREAFRLSAEGMTRAQIARLYRVDPSTVSKTLLGKKWKHLGLKSG